MIWVSESIISLTNVSKQFRRKTALHNLDFALIANNVYGFSGPNGSGKTLTFKVILGFVKATTGTVIVKGDKIREDRLFAPDIGFAIHEYGPLPTKTGRENLALLAILAGTPANKISELLRYVGLDPEDDRLVRDYSLGMTQRLLIATALIGDAPIVILDEPTNALDEDGQAFLVAMIADLKQRRKTVLVSSHDAAFLERVSDHIFYYREGTIFRERVK